jgi:hypothetical protein
LGELSNPVVEVAKGSAEIADPTIERVSLPAEPLATHQELMTADAQRALPIAAVPVAVDSLS